MSVKGMTRWLEGVFRQGPLPRKEHHERIAELLKTGKSMARTPSQPRRSHLANLDVDGGGYGRVCSACGKTELEIRAYGIRDCPGAPRPQHSLELGSNVVAVTLVSNIENPDEEPDG